MVSGLVQTLDGSFTLYDEQYADHYHSLNGALTESMHIYIKCGFHEVFMKKNEISLLEVGFGTGLNALCTFNESVQYNISVNYTAIEPFPIDAEITAQLNYQDLFPLHSAGNVYLQMHSLRDGITHRLAEDFRFRRIELPVEKVILPGNSFDLVYFDPFRPESHPEIWSKEVFHKLFLSLKSNGVLVTYSSKGDVRRALRDAGFRVSKIPGPSGKREISRAVKEQ